MTLRLRPLLIAAIPSSRWHGSLRGLADVIADRATDIDLIFREATLVVTTDIALVAGIGLDELALSWHTIDPLASRDS